MDDPQISAIEGKLMKRVALVGLGVLLLITLIVTPGNAHAGGQFGYSGQDLIANWTNLTGSGSPLGCGGVWGVDQHGTYGFRPPSSTCEGSVAGIALDTRPNDTMTQYGSQIYVTYFTLILEWDNAGLCGDCQAVEYLTVNQLYPTDQVQFNWNEGSYQACSTLLGAGLPCPYIIGIIVNYDYVIAPLTSAPTNTPALPTATGPSPTGISGTFGPPTFLPTNTPDLNTLVASPLPTIGDLDSCAGDPFAPCGTMPYAMVYLPTLNLPSPSAWPTVDTPTPIPITVTPLPTNTPTGTLPSPTPIYVGATITSYPSPAFDFDGIATQVGMTFGTLAPLAGAQIAFNGTPSGIVDLAGQLGAGAGRAIGFINAIQGTDINTAGGLITAAILIVIFVVLVEVLVLILPFLLMIIRILLQAIGALKPF